MLRRLRERGEPIKMFGESPLETYRRLRQLEMIEPHGTKSHQNDFKSAMDKIDKVDPKFLVHTNYTQQTCIVNNNTATF